MVSPPPLIWASTAVQRLRLCVCSAGLVAARLVRVRRAPPVLQLARLVAVPDLVAAVAVTRRADLGCLVRAAVGARPDRLHPREFLAALAAPSAAVRPVRGDGPMRSDESSKPQGSISVVRLNKLSLIYTTPGRVCPAKYKSDTGAVRVRCNHACSVADPHPLRT